MRWLAVAMNGLIYLAIGSAFALVYVVLWRLVVS